MPNPLEQEMFARAGGVAVPSEMTIMQFLDSIGGLPVDKKGGVDLTNEFFRKVESSRGLPRGVLSAMAEKESGGNARKKGPGSAGGLFQITDATAKDWKIPGGSDRYNPVLATVAVANTLAARAQKYGIERAVGMHYGGPGTPWDQVVGTSGLSPQQYAEDVFKRAAGYQ